jgi:AcrR family transcriptional regulator
MPPEPSAPAAVPVFFEDLKRLPPGRHSIAVEEVVRQQRMRLMAAMLDAVGEQGYIATSVADVLSRAGISRRTFYEHFSDKEDCYLQAYDHVTAMLFETIAASFVGHRRWQDAMRAGLDVFLRTVAANPRFARACLGEILTVGPEGVRRRDASLTPFQQFFEMARELAPAEASIPETVTETLVGGILETICARVMRDEADRVPELLDQLMFWGLVPFVGPVEANQALAEMAAAAR